MTDPVRRLLRDRSADGGGDDSSAKALLERFLPDLRAFFRMRLGPHLRARETDSDMVQTVCREVLQDLSEFRGDDPDEFKRWLFLTAFRKIKDRDKFWGRARRAADREDYRLDDRQERSAYVDLLTPSRVAMGREQVSAFEQAFDALPEEQRIVITSAKVLGLSNAEIGAEIGKSEDAVRMALHRALARIGRLLEAP